VSDTEKALLDFIAAIRDTLDLPVPAGGEANEQAWRRLQYDRARDVVSHVNVLLAPSTDISPEIITTVLRERIQESPVTYQVWEPAPDAQDSPKAVDAR
jgi:hypothetical protein